MKRLAIISAILAGIAILLSFPVPSRAQETIEVPTESALSSSATTEWCTGNNICGNVTISDDNKSFLLGFLSVIGDFENNSSQYVYDVNSNTPCFSSTVWGYAFSIITPSDPATWGEGEWSCTTGVHLFVQYDSTNSIPIGMMFFRYVAETGEIFAIDSTPASLSDVTFGLTILIVIAFLFGIGFMFNHITSKKPWR